MEAATVAGRAAAPAAPPRPSRVPRDRPRPGRKSPPRPPRKSAGSPARKSAPRPARKPHGSRRSRGSRAGPQAARTPLVSRPHPDPDRPRT